VSKDEHLYPWKRWLMCVGDIIFIAFYLNNFSKVLISWRLTKMLKESEDAEALTDF
jgi:hypothetical protein